MLNQIPFYNLFTHFIMQNIVLTISCLSLNSHLLNELSLSSIPLTSKNRLKCMRSKSKEAFQEDYSPEPYIGCPYPCPCLCPPIPMGFGWAWVRFYCSWVGMGAILLFMGGHGWASVLCIPASNSKSESNFSDVGNTLTKKRSELKPATMNDLLFVRSNQDLV
jgi:hypothetical protein